MVQDGFVSEEGLMTIVPLSFVADVIVLIHFAYIVFVMTGGLLALRWRRIIWIHIPAALWGALVEFTGWICPLTPLELLFRIRGGETPYEEGFVEHYLLPLLYPADLTPQHSGGTGDDCCGS